MFMSDNRRESRVNPAPPAATKPGHGMTRMATLGVAVLWLGGLAAYLSGYFGPALFEPKPFGVTLGILALAFMPIMLVAALVELSIQGRTLSDTNRLLGRLS